MMMRMIVGKKDCVYVSGDDCRLLGAFEGILLGSWDATYVGIMDCATDGDSHETQFLLLTPVPTSQLYY